MDQLDIEKLYIQVTEIWHKSLTKYLIADIAELVYDYHNDLLNWIKFITDRTNTNIS